MTNFAAAFHNATGNAPYLYQTRLACGQTEDLGIGTPCQSQLIEIPTGLGKTAAVVMAWLWNRALQSDEESRAHWPRRLVYCLPMRTLVEQTRDNVERWLTNLTNLGLLNRRLGVHILMGGEDGDDWDIYPEKEAILIGTQDMLLSRALNRGYGMSRYRWPIHFGLLNNDCLWVLDETQLMGPGLGTACQLEAFRLKNGPDCQTRFNSYPNGISVTWYSSATGNLDHLKTREWREVNRPDDFVFRMTDAEKQEKRVARRLNANKVLEFKPHQNFGDKQNELNQNLVEAIVNRHSAMVEGLKNLPDLPRRTLVICNTVDRAVAVHGKVKQMLGSETSIELKLMHSRFRPVERLEQVRCLDEKYLKNLPRGQIIIATQVVEAGVDISSAILWTEVAPLACLVQRLGRLNRTGEFADSSFDPKAIIVGIESPNSEAKTKEQREKAEADAKRRYLPYEKDKCDRSWKDLEVLKKNASPSSIGKIQSAISESINRCPYSLQKHELLDFFDTDANLSLGFTDVSPFVRGTGEDSDIYVAWRDDWSEKHEPPQIPYANFQRQELCSVSIGKVRDARGLLSKGWFWRGRHTGWSSVQSIDISPGITILLPISARGYNPELGWTGREEVEDQPMSVYIPRPPKSDEETLSILQHGWQSISEHTDDVVQQFKLILEGIGKKQFSATELKFILRAIYWHDAGKNHKKWQEAVKEALRKAEIDLSLAKLPIGKFSLSHSPRLKNLTDNALKEEVNRLRWSFSPKIDHEVVSALAFRQYEQSNGAPRSLESLLAEYLIMSHHGAVRKVLRDEIPRYPEEEKDMNTVRGVRDGSELQPVTVAGTEMRCDSLSTDCRRMGRDAHGNESYTRGVLRLLDYYGPFRLAFLESILRIADIRASKIASEKTEA